MRRSERRAISRSRVVRRAESGSLKAELFGCPRAAIIGSKLLDIKGSIQKSVKISEKAKELRIISST